MAMGMVVNQSMPLRIACFIIVAMACGGAGSSGNRRSYSQGALGALAPRPDAGLVSRPVTLARLDLTADTRFDLTMHSFRAADGDVITGLHGHDTRAGGETVHSPTVVRLNDHGHVRWAVEIAPSAPDGRITALVPLPGDAAAVAFTTENTVGVVVFEADGRFVGGSPSNLARDT